MRHTLVTSLKAMVKAFKVSSVWGGRIRTSAMAVPKTAALPLGDTPTATRRENSRKKDFFKQ